MVHLRERNRAQYDYLIGEYFNLSQELAEITANSDKKNMRETQEYTQLNEKHTKIEARIDRIVSEFEAEDFHLMLQQVD